ncbi:DUF4328 domain-containing protein [Planomonospora sp. ID67723]|uniref:DUF4328 domain-containing protein n=1 Tax=Planomonospora sp. ID67723 TaxID=2738134 RepID=UPI0018C43D4D|nr:DUF4328 domain-containing protein [Planomonospora sp. ID67723]MBG0831586.1 DUF4328 domain-containing protein [Planomonospora sp. ID67723]
MHPSHLAAPPAPTLLTPVRPIRGLAITVVVLLGVTTLVDLAALVITVDRVFLLSALIEAPDTVDMVAVDCNDFLYLASAIPMTATFFTTAVVFMIWLFRARANAQALMVLPHRRHAAWIVFGWGFPIVHLWYPRQIVDDIWITSKLGSAGFTTLGHLTLDTVRRSPLVLAWWLSWLVSMVASAFAYSLADGEDLPSYLLTAKIEVFFAAPSAICAALAATVVWKITAFQERSVFASPPAG